MVTSPFPIVNPTTMKVLTGYNPKFMITDEYARIKKKFTPVCPPRIYLSMALSGYVPDTILLLAHDVVANAEEYAHVFNMPKFRDTTIIMDNSVAELGTAVDIDMVFEAAETVEADYVVLPDVYGDGRKTYLAIKEVIHEWMRRFNNYKNIAVIHGSSICDFVDTAEDISSLPGIDMISIPRKLELDYLKIGYHRHELIPIANMFFKNKPIHLLGFSDTIFWDLLAAQNPSVVSIDSAVPLRKFFSPSCPTSARVEPRGTWWQDVEFTPQMVESCKYIDSLIGNN